MWSAKPWLLSFSYVLHVFFKTIFPISSLGVGVGLPTSFQNSLHPHCECFRMTLFHGVTCGWLTKHQGLRWPTRAMLPPSTGPMSCEGESKWPLWCVWLQPGFGRRLRPGRRTVQATLSNRGDTGLGEARCGTSCWVTVNVLVWVAFAFAHNSKLKPTSALHLPNYLIHTVICTCVLI